MKYFTILSTTLLILLTAAPTGAVGDEWMEIPPSEAKIVFDAPGLIGSGKFNKGSTSYASLQYGTWFSGPLSPIAQVYMEELHPNYLRKSRNRLEHSLKEWDFLKGKSSDLEAIKKAVNVLGNVEYRQFKVEELHCVGFGQHYGPVHYSPFDTDFILPNYISGYYCDTKPLTDNLVKAVIQALGVRGYKTPRTNESAEKNASERMVICYMERSIQVEVTYAYCQRYNGRYVRDVK